MDKYKDMVSSMAFWNLDEVASFLIAARERGLHIVYTFNDVDLDSDKIKTVDDAYIIKCGYTKAEYEEKREAQARRMLEEWDKESKDTGNSISK